jgi:hypothetical protein
VLGAEIAFRAATAFWRDGGCKRVSRPPHGTIVRRPTGCRLPRSWDQCEGFLPRARWQATQGAVEVNLAPRSVGGASVALAGCGHHARRAASRDLCRYRRLTSLRAMAPDHDAVARTLSVQRGAVSGRRRLTRGPAADTRGIADRSGPSFQDEIRACRRDLCHIFRLNVQSIFRASNYVHSARSSPALAQVSTAIRTGYLPWRRSAD